MTERTLLLIAFDWSPFEKTQSSDSNRLSIDKLLVEPDKMKARNMIRLMKAACCVSIFVSVCFVFKFLYLTGSFFD